MVDGISSSGYQAVGMTFASNQSEALTDEQKEKLEEILSNYDPTNMTEDDKKTLMDELKSSGIKPSEEVKSIIEDAGFDMEPPQGPPPSDGENQVSRPGFIQEAIDKYNAGELTEEDLQELMEKLQESGEPPQGILLDQKS